MLILAALVLRERVPALRWLAVSIGFIGVIVMTAPSGAAFQPMALVALLGAVFMSGELISLRHIALRDSALTALYLTNLVGLLISGALAPFFWHQPTFTQWELMAFIGAVTVAGQVFFIRAVAFGEASLLAPLFYSTLVYASIFGFLVFDEVPSTRTLIGSALIIAAGVSLGRIQRRA